MNWKKLNPFRRTHKLTKAAIERGYNYLASIGGQNSDWIMSGITDDADLRNNIHALRNRCRDLWKENPYVRKFRSDLLANVFGSEGISMQSKVREEADRVIHTPDEKAFLQSKKSEAESRREFLAERGITIRPRYIWDEKKATIKAGQPDLYANNLIEKEWKRWQKKQNCTVGKRHTYAQTREHRLSMAARDGDCFIRLIRGFKNDFGFAIQLIASEFIDHDLNAVLSSGHEIKMGVEYDKYGAAVAYYAIKRKPMDWQYSQWGGGYASFGGENHERIDARDIIHYCAHEDSESGRGAPWISSIIPKVRQLDKYEETSVVSARAEACKGGHYIPEIGGLDMVELADRYDKSKGQMTEEVEPGMWKALPFGWKAQAHDPKHPNGNYPDFRKSILRGVSAGLPGSHYNTLGSDYEGVNYTSYKAARIDVNEVYKIIQRFDIDTAERPIFEAWLEMALASGVVPLPLSKFEKFNQPRFQGRRWQGLEPLKEATANEKNLAMCLTSRTRITQEAGNDFEEIIEEQIMEKVMLEDAGIYQPLQNPIIPPEDLEEDEPKNPEEET